MNCMFVCNHGLICDRLQYVLDKIYSGSKNNYFRVNDAMGVYENARNKDIIIVDHNFETNGDGIEILAKLYKKVGNTINTNTKVLLICMPEEKELLDKMLVDGYEYWFRTIIKGDSINTLRKALYRL